MRGASVLGWRLWFPKRGRFARLEQAFDVPLDGADVELDLSLSISTRSILAYTLHPKPDTLNHQP